MEGSDVHSQLGDAETTAHTIPRPRWAMWKTGAQRKINAKKLTPAYCANIVMNDGVWKGGFAASRWVLGKYP